MGVTGSQMRDYYIVDTAFQLMCAREAREEFGKGRINHLIIEARGGNQSRKLNLAQMLDLVDDRWHNVTTNIYPLKKGSKRSLVRIYQSLRTRFKFGSGERLYSGIASEKWNKIYAKLYGATHPIRIDDGTATILFLQDLRIKTHAHEKMVAYSIFAQLDDPPAIVRNSLKQLRSESVKDQIILPGMTWVVGGAYSETKALNLVDELRILTSLLGTNSATTCLYLPHRDDSQSKLKTLQAYGYYIAEIGPNLEQRLLTSKELPRKIIGIASTTLFTANLLQPKIKISAVMKNCFTKPNYPLIYDEAKKLGISIIHETELMPMEASASVPF